MSGLGVRPRFSQTLELGVEEAQVRIMREVARVEDQCEMKSFPKFVCLRIPEVDRHFWSPRLNLVFEEEGEDVTRVEGTYGPNANVWALFLFGYMIVGSLALFSGILGFSQLAVDNPAWGFWPFALFSIVLVGLYVAAQFGKKLGAPQTHRLHRIYEEAMGQSAEIR